MRQFYFTRAIRAIVILFCFLSTLSELKAQDALGSALQYLQENRAEYGLTAADIQEYRISDQYTSDHNGLTHIYLNQQYQGIDLFAGQIGLHVTRNNAVIFMTNRFVPDLANVVNTTQPVRDGMMALNDVLSILNLNPTKQLEVLSPPAGPMQKTLFNDLGISQESIPVQLVFQRITESDVRLAWEVRIYELNSQHWWNVRVDAVTGQELDRNDWVVNCEVHPHEFEHPDPAPNFKAETSPLTPAPPKVMVPNSYRVYPEPVESPNHGGRTVQVVPWDLNASPFGWHDTNGAAGAEFTITRGNNVHAQEDQNGNNGTGASPDGGALLDFDFQINLNQQPNTYVEAATTNLFYWNNLVHDVLWHYGFNEAAGNFQSNNYGRGGAGGDYVFADAQDGSGLNNANFGTPPDGNNPRMQMFLWSGTPANIFTVNSPAGIAGSYTALEAAFGPGLNATPINGNLVIADDGSANGSQACNAVTNGAAINGNIALIDRGNCTFVQKVLNAQNAGAVACVVCNNQNGGPITMGGNNGAINIPSVMIGLNDCNTIKASLAGNTVNITLQNGGSVNLDGDLDNGIIAHEYGHGVSNRLTGGPNNTSCLGNQEQMGEGWSDYLSLIFTIEPGDLGTDIRGIGTFAIGQPTTGGGIRPAPYTTNMASNPFTYGDITNTGAISRPHGVGFLWNTMLWDLTWLLIDRYGYDQDLINGNGGNNLALQLIMDGMALQACRPGFVDGRDAIIAADLALTGGVNECLIWEAFARRGLGVSATQGSNNSRTDGSQAFDIPVACTLLPVDFLSVDATPELYSIRLDWTVTGSPNSAGYEILRRAPGEASFTKVGQTPPGPANRIRSSHQFTDHRVEQRVLYEYRIRQYDIDGQDKLSDVVTAIIQPGEDLKLSVFPNPANDRITLSLEGLAEGDAVITLRNLIGQQIHNQTIPISQLQNGGTELDLSNVAAGQYLLEVRTGEKSMRERLIIR